MTAFVAYYRVSTDRQGQSGLGLDAQKHDVQAYVTREAGTILREFREIESGKRNDRPVLAKAIAFAKGQGATLVIAKLDRLSRNVHFLSGLLESKVPFVACDNPHATRLTIHILAAVAEDEARRISERTKAALAEAKRRGVKLGGAAHKKRRRKAKVKRKRLSRHQVCMLGTRANQAKRDAFIQRMRPVIAKLRAKGWTLGQVAAELNYRGYRTRTMNRMWSLANVSRIAGGVILPTSSGRGCSNSRKTFLTSPKFHLRDVA